LVSVVDFAIVQWGDA